MRREGLQLLRLRIVSNGDECLERRLGVEPFVFVHFVRTDGRLDRGIELHPGDVARVVVVRHERVGARGQELLEGRLGRGVRGLPKVRRGVRELPLVFDRIRNRRETLGPLSDRGEEPGGGRLRVAAEAVQPLLDLILGRSGRIEVGGFGFDGHARNERLVVIESRPRTFVDQEVMEAGFGGSPFRSGRPSHDVTTQLLQQGVVTSPDLPQEEAVHDPRRLDEMSERLSARCRRASSGRRLCPPARSARSSCAARSSMERTSSLARERLRRKPRRRRSGPCMRSEQGIDASW